mgnify:FL=1
MPAAVPAQYAEDEPFLQALHHAIMEVEIIEGCVLALPIAPPRPGSRPPPAHAVPHAAGCAPAHRHLVCPETSKRFPIKDGIPSLI